MSTKPKLNQEQERQVALAYLCNVDTSYIGQRWGISDATIRNKIFSKRSLEWNDPLVEFYRQTHSRNRVRNSAHLYLAFNGREVPKGDLVNGRTDGHVYDAVVENLYTPGIEDIVQNTSLRRFLKPTNGFELLLGDIFGINIDGHAHEVVLRVFKDKLHDEYTKDGKFYLDDVLGRAEKDVIKGIKYGGAAFTPKKAELIYQVLKTLNPKEEKILRALYGLDDGSPKRREEVDERIIRIKEKAIRKLRHPFRSRDLRFLVGLVTDADVDSYMAKRNYVIETKVAANVLQNGKKWIDELELSIGTYKILADSNIKTVDDILQLTEPEFLSLKNSGRKFLNEINAVLAKMGLSIRKE